MKTFISILTLAFSVFFFGQNAQAQNDDRAYVIVDYMKVKPGMDGKYRACERARKIIHQERVKAGYITGWELEQVVFPSGMNTEYDYLTITHLKNWKGIDDLQGTWTDEIWAKLTSSLTAEQKEVADNAEEYRDIVKREIWTAGNVLLPQGARPLYRVENYMKTPEGGMDTWVDMETKFVRPVHEKSVEMGTRAGWLMGFMVLPRGDHYAYNVSSIDMYDSWEDMDKSEQKAWDMIYPTMTEDQIGSVIAGTRTVVKTEVRRLVDYTE